MLAWLVFACGGDKDANDADGDTTAHSGSTTEPVDEQFERCMRRCERGAEGASCDADAIEGACSTYCVDPPPLPEECEPFFEDYETCAARVEEWTCVGSSTQVGGVVVPVPSDPYECSLESLELLACAAVPDPGCTPTLGGSGAACTLDATLCNASGVTFDADLLCDGVICSLLVDDGSPPPEDETFPRADQLCAELLEKSTAPDDALARFLVTLTGL